MSDFHNILDFRRPPSGLAKGHRME